MRFLICLMALLFPVVAYAGDTVLSLAPVTNYLIEYAVVAAVGVAGWALSRVTNGLRKWLGIRIDDSQRAVVMGAVERGANYAADVLREHIRVKGLAAVDVRSELIKAGISYVQNRVPDALAHFKLSPTDVGDMIAAQLQNKGIRDEIGNLIKADAGR